MSSRLDHVTDWAMLAVSSKYRVAKLARECEVNPRQLERYFRIRHGAPPHQWMRDLRMRQAVELIRDRTPLKVVATELGYKYPATFTHDFKGYFGVTPSSFSQNPTLAASARQNVAF
jgi:AraC-like DNA-binding protein